MAKYIPVIGMEIHVELKTRSKMFCSCRNEMAVSLKDKNRDPEPNIHICPVCSGQPGTLPVPNAKAIEFVQLAGLALDCQLASESKFDRKNYFYPDLPKGYQISQYDQPLCEKGKLKIDGKEIGITRIHLEEDTGKLVHPKGADFTLVDFNRAGVPLMELVTEPDFASGEEARIFCQKLQQVCRYLGISDADMEKGHMRCEANISLHKKGEDRLSGTKVEVKNINSFKFVEKAINFEIQRQTDLLEKGERVIQETRGYDSNRGATVSQRIKESAHDYRYFPEPDIPPLKFDQGYFQNLKRKLPELPEAKFSRFKKEYGLNEADAAILTSERGLAGYFEEVSSELREKIDCGEIKTSREKGMKLAANYIITELRRYLAENGEDIASLKVTPENYAELIGMAACGTINSSAVQTVLAEMYLTGGDPSQIVEEKNLSQVSDTGELEKIVEDVLKENSKSTADFQAGKENALKFLIGQVMKKTCGKANPQLAQEIIVKKLKK